MSIARRPKMHTQRPSPQHGAHPLYMFSIVPRRGYRLEARNNLPVPFDSKPKPLQLPVCTENNGKGTQRASAGYGCRPSQSKPLSPRKHQSTKTALRSKRRHARSDFHPLLRSTPASQVPSNELFGPLWVGARRRNHVERRARCDVDGWIFVQSQLIIVHLRRLQESADLHGPLPLVFLRLGRSQLALLREELGIVTRELLQRDEEVS